jgi:hypothetical protein
MKVAKQTKIQISQDELSPAKSNGKWEVNAITFCARDLCFWYIPFFAMSSEKSRSFSVHHHRNRRDVYAIFQTRTGPGERITRAEVLQRARDLIIQAGLGNHSRSEFVRRLAAELVGSENPAFVRFQPTPHDKNSLAWEQAYAFIFQYLVFHKLSGTLETANAETGADPPEVPTAPTDDQFLELVGQGGNIPPLPDRVEELFPKKKKVTSPRPLARRTPRPQTPSRRRTGKTRSGKTTPLRIGSPPRDGGVIDSDDLGSDIVVTDVYERPR